MSWSLRLTNLAWFPDGQGGFVSAPLQPGACPDIVDMTIPIGASPGVMYFTDSAGNLITPTQYEFQGGVLVHVDQLSPL